MSFIPTFRSLLSLGLAFVATSASYAETERTIYSFTGGADGSHANNLLLDSTGVIYTSSTDGGILNHGYYRGAISSIDPATGTLTTLYSFKNHADGDGPWGLTRIHEGGAFFGVTWGGAANAGTIFKFDPIVHKLTTLYTFAGAADGRYPVTALVADQNGMLYGVTSPSVVGGNPGPTPGGTVFKFDPVSKVLTTLHIFSGGADGSVPSSLVVEPSGALFGATYQGGQTLPGFCNFGCGTVFKIDLAMLAFSTLHSFSDGADGAGPSALVIDGAIEAIYGTAAHGGAYLGGTIFEVDPASGAFSTAHAFNDRNQDGQGNYEGGQPGQLISRGMRTVLFGSTNFGGPDNKGTIFSFNAMTGKLKTPYSLTPTDGHYADGLAVDPNGVIYGATSSGDLNTQCFLNCGTIFQVTP